MSDSEVSLLVIGYGNTLRSDDGVGARVAEAIEELGLPGVRAIARGLLTPELAEPISKARTVVFVDASLAGTEVELRPLSPGESSQILAHAADPCTLLALARDVFGQAPRGWWLTIPIESLGVGETLSLKANQGLERAIEAIRNIAASAVPARR